MTTQVSSCHLTSTDLNLKNICHPLHYQIRHQSLMYLLESKASVIIENTVLFLYILTIHSPQTALLVKEVALNSGILLDHFFNSIFSPIDGQKFLSRYLCSLWFSGSADCAEKQLLKRLVPPGFLSFLSMPILSEAGTLMCIQFLFNFP